MEPATLKYFGEQDSRYGGPQQWPGANGFPVLSDTRVLLKKHEINNLPIVGSFYERVFDLNDEAARADYSWVQDRAANGLFVIKHIDRRPATGSDYPVIYMEWIQYAAIIPPQFQGSVEHGSATRFTLSGS